MKKIMIIISIYLNNIKIKRKIKNNNRKKQKKELTNFLSSIFQKEPNERPSIKELIKHPWIEFYNNNNNNNFDSLNRVLFPFFFIIIIIIIIN